MRKANPNRRFTAEDILPEKFDMLNAFWGANIGNNFERILGVDGTIYFNFSSNDFVGQGLDANYVDSTRRMYYLPMSALELHAVPIVQTVARLETPYNISTTLVPFKPEMVNEWRNFTPNVGPLDTSFTAVTDRDSSMSEPPFYQNGKLFKLGMVQDEIMRVTSHVLLAKTELGALTRYTSLVQMQRAVFPNTGSDSYPGGEQMLDVYEYSATNLSGTSSYTDLNPPYVQTLYDGESLIFNWLNDSGGTLYYKVFGA